MFECGEIRNKTLYEKNCKTNELEWKMQIQNIQN